MRASTLTLKLTYRCAGRCLYCDRRRRMWSARGGGVMSMRLVARIFDQLRALPTRPFERVHLSGGEVSTYGHLLETLRRAEAAGPRISVTTAGWQGRKGSWARTLEVTPIHHLYVSLDHPEPRIDDSIRGAGSHQRAIAAIREAVAHRARFGIPEVIVISVISRMNARDLGSVIDLASDEGADRWLPAVLEHSMDLPNLRPTLQDLDLLNRACQTNHLLDTVLGQRLRNDFVFRCLVLDGVIADSRVREVCPTRGRLLIVHPQGQAYACYASEYLELTPVADMIATPLSEAVRRLSHAKPHTSACSWCPEQYQSSNPLLKVIS